jgi:hypothetical protein
MSFEEEYNGPDTVADMCALVCPNCAQLWLTTAHHGEPFMCRKCRHAFRAGEDSPLEVVGHGPKPGTRNTWVTSLRGLVERHTGEREATGK